MLCTYCKKREINTGRSTCRCTICLDGVNDAVKKSYKKNSTRALDAAKEHYKKHKEEIKEYSKNRSLEIRKERLESGICTYCGERVIDYGRSKQCCSICLDVKNELEKGYVKRHYRDVMDRKKIYAKNNGVGFRRRSLQYYYTHKEDCYARIRQYRARKLNASGSFTEDEWQDVLQESGGKCLNCGTTEKIERDHVVPLSKGGSNYIGNIQPLCRSCNSSKSAKTIDFRPYGNWILEWT